MSRGREVWPWWRRFTAKVAVGLRKLLIEPLLDHKGNGSIPAWLSLGLGAAMIYRLVAKVPVGWPDAWIVFACFIGVALYEAALTLARTDPGALFDKATSPFGRANDAVERGAEVTTTLEQQITPQKPGPEGQETE
jgi:hypothetical protein